MIGNDFDVLEFVHHGFHLGFEIDAGGFVKQAAVVPKDNVAVLQVVDEITSRILVDVGIVKLCLCVLLQDNAVPKWVDQSYIFQDRNRQGYDYWT
jgi:hypothetical protein